MYFYIATGILILLSIIAYRFIMYHMVISKPWIVIVILLLIALAPTGYKLTTTVINKPSVPDVKQDKGFISNQDSEYSQLWLDYLSFRDGEIGRLGSEERFKSFLKEKGFTERTYALEVIRDMLDEKGVEDTSIADKCVEENIVGSLE